MQHARTSRWQSSSLSAEKMKALQQSERGEEEEETKSEKWSEAARLVPKDSVLSSSFAVRCSRYPFYTRELQTELKPNIETDHRARRHGSEQLA